MRKIIVGVFILLFLVIPHAGDAVDFNAIIASLRTQIAVLQAQIQNLLVGSSSPSSTVETKFDIYLYRGLSHPQVRSLQEFLARDPSLYPERLVTGYFGSLTEAAIKRFQVRYGIPAIGVVDPQTRAKLNELISPPAIEPTAIIATTTPAVIERLAAVPEDGDLVLNQKPDYNIAAIEKLVQDRINRERTLQGARPVVWSNALANVARRHSAEHVSDNLEITDPQLPCAYPILHHTGFTFGTSVAERVRSSGISYRKVGENLAMFPVSTQLIYRYRVSDGQISCPSVEPLDPFVSSRAEINQAVQQRKNILASVRKVEWVNREWLTAQEIAEKAFDLWLNSPSHRDNMLDPDFVEGGIGIAVVNDHFVVTHVLLER